MATYPDYERMRFAPTRAPELDGQGAPRRPVVVVGAGPVGLSCAIDLAQQGIPVLLLDEDERLSQGSRALCFAKRTLEIFDRLGCGEPFVEKGVGWQRGKVFFREGLVYEFDLLPEPGHKRPAFVNLQQFYCEGFLVERALALPNLEIRWKSRVTALSNDVHGVTLGVDSSEGAYTLRTDWLVACDGARSPLRGLMGLESKGRVFRDRFLIADVRMKADFPTERWFWFDPAFHPNQSVLLHKEPDDVWRIDFQLGWDADPEEERKPERVLPRVRALLGHDADFELVWASVYTFACMRMERFRHGRVLFAGDAAHGVSPFGARGANSGVQDAENLAWKLARVLQGRSPEALLDSYDTERVFAADENILNSTRATDFITPKSRVSRVFRDAVLELSREAPFARRLLNSGRLSVPALLTESVLNTPDAEPFEAPRCLPGAPVQDAPVRAADGGPDVHWFTDALERRFTLLVALPAEGGDVVAAKAREALALLRTVDEDAELLLLRPRGSTDTSAMPGEGRVLDDVDGLVHARHDLRPGSTYLYRPDQHVAARLRTPDGARLRAAALRAAGLSAPAALARAA